MSTTRRSLPALLAAALLTIIPVAHASSGFHLIEPKVSPAKVFFDGGGRAELRYSFGGERRRTVRVQVVRVRDGKVADSWLQRSAKPRHRYTVRWGGLRRNGKLGEDGAYAFKVGPVTGVKRRVGSFHFHSYAFPVDGAHGTRGPIGDFGAPRSGGRVHEGFDITANCGTPIRAARGGRVQKVGYDPDPYGNYVLIDGRKTKRDTFYAHMIERTPFSRGERVRTGQGLGRVGQTGNAAGTPCHLHFELHDRGRPIDPEPRLRRWDRWS